MPSRCYIHYSVRISAKFEPPSPSPPPHPTPPPPLYHRNHGALGCVWQTSARGKQKESGRRRSYGEVLSNAPSELKAGVEEKLYEKKEDLNQARSARLRLCLPPRKRPRPRPAPVALCLTLLLTRPGWFGSRKSPAPPIT